MTGMRVNTIAFYKEYSENIREDEKLFKLKESININ